MLLATSPACTELETHVLDWMVEMLDLPEYLKNKATESGAVIDYHDWQVPLGRRFRALKLWFVIRSFGVAGLQARVREHVALAQEFAAWVDADPRFQRAAPAPLNLVCFRHRGGDEANQQILDRLTLRVCIGQTNTQRKHVENAWRRICEAADQLPPVQSG